MRGGVSAMRISYLLRMMLGWLWHREQLLPESKPPASFLRTFSTAIERVYKGSTEQNNRQRYWKHKKSNTNTVILISHFVCYLSSSHNTKWLVSKRKAITSWKVKDYFRCIRSFFPYKNRTNRSQQSRSVYRAICWNCNGFTLVKLNDGFMMGKPNALRPSLKLIPQPLLTRTKPLYITSSIIRIFW